MQLNRYLGAAMLLTATSVAACSMNDGSVSSADVHSSSSASAPALVGARAVKANDALFHVRGILANGSAAQIGKLSPADLDRASLGAELPVYYASLDDLARYDGASDPRDAFGPERERIVSVNVDGEARALVSMSADPSGNWQVTGVGRASFAKALDEASRRVSARLGDRALSLIVVPKLGLRMLVHDEAGDVMLTPLDDVGGTPLGAGHAVSARIALHAIAAARPPR